MADLELCAAISDAFGPSGYEKEAVDVIESSLGGLAAHRDSMQNLYVSLPQNVGGRPLVMLDAHTDEVGFMVQSITATGLLRIVPLGGWVEHNIPAHTFLLHNRRGETVRAVSTSKPPHLQEAGESKKKIELRDLYIDTGYPKEALEEKVSVGDAAGFFAPALPLENRMVTSKALDDRICAFSILRAAETVDRAKLTTDVCILLSGGGAELFGLCEACAAKQAQ